MTGLSTFLALYRAAFSTVFNTRRFSGVWILNEHKLMLSESNRESFLIFVLEAEVQASVDSASKALMDSRSLLVAVGSREALVSLLF
jgi:hypothetical protein